MNRAEFEALRDLEGKVIKGDIRFAKRDRARPALEAAGVKIETESDLSLRLDIRYNPEVGSTTFNVTAIGVGPICRLDVDGHRHGDAGRCHKHSVQSERCPDRNLPDGTVAMPDLSGRSVAALFATFCEMAKIEHQGEIEQVDTP